MTKQKPSKKSAKVLVSRERAEAEALFFSIGEGAIATDELGNITRINNVALEILGYEVQDVIGKWYPDTFIAEDQNGRPIANIELPITEAFLTGKPVFKRVFYRRKNSTRVPIALTISPIIIDDEPVGAIGVFRDITKEVELENSKDEFISIASHQLRTPATVVKQYMGMLIDGYVGKLSSEQTDMLAKAYEYNDTQLHIISDLLKVAQADANKITAVRKETDFVTLLKEVIASEKSSYDEHQLTLTFTSNPTSVMCVMDPLHMRMVFENLLSNARKYSPDKGKVNVVLEASPTQIIVRVSDTGIGIAAADLPRLFHKFSRIHNPLSSASGTGLGLYWAKKLIDLHGGTVTIDSKVNQGTTFTVTIPRDHNA
ncbi:MAG: sensor histidine kinase [Candidatus Saccharimonadales bacterium]